MTKKPDLNLRPQAMTPEINRDCKSCNKETPQKLELVDPKDLDSDLIWVCKECKKPNDIFDLKSY